MSRHARGLALALAAGLFAAADAGADAAADQGAAEVRVHGPLLAGRGVGGGGGVDRLADRHDLR